MEIKQLLKNISGNKRHILNLKKMKINILFVTLLLSATLCTSQNFEEISKYEFKTTESYESEKGTVLKCANYLFENPANLYELNRLNAQQYIMKWMEGTPEYTFEIGEKAMELTKGNSDLLGLYLAAMSKSVIEHEGEAKLTSNEIYKKSETMLLAYAILFSALKYFFNLFGRLHFIFR
ncbi:MAG: hypothetical protein AAGL29_16390, partial [Bacteroidota bacterium]